MVNHLKDKYIILELIPTNSSSEKGEIVQIQALKLEGLKLKDRFNYRLNLAKIANQDLRNILNYDNEAFNYVDNSLEIITNFQDFIEDLPLLIIDNSYTKDYLKNIKNYQESIFKHLNLTYQDDIFDILLKKYNLVPSNHLVDLLYESLIMESNVK